MTDEELRTQVRAFLMWFHADGSPCDGHRFRQEHAKLLAMIDCEKMTDESKHVLTIKADHVVGMFVLTCICLGLLTGCISLGVGLIFLSVSQAIGVGILTFGVGSILAGMFGGRPIIVALVKTMKEQAEESKQWQSG